MASGAGQRVLSQQQNNQPLGPNSNILNRGPDAALLKPSIKTSVTGVRQIIKALEVSSLEIRDYLLNEVNVVYECKVCMNMFRSLANLTAHKRSYCLERFENVTHVFSSKANCEASLLKTVMIEGETVETVKPEDIVDTENYSPSLDLLKDAGMLSELEEKKPAINRLLPPQKASLLSVVDRLTARKAREYIDDISDKVDVEENNELTDAVYMEPISQTFKAQFQSYSTGQRIKEIKALNTPVSLTVGPDGKEITSKDPSFDRSKSPEDTEDSKENIDEDYDPNAAVDDNGNTVKYPCPECKKGFSKVGNVYKHLSNHHGKTKDEYTKLRKEIQDNAYVVDKENGLEKPPKSTLQNLALAIGLVNKQGVGMQKINKPDKPVERTSEENALNELQAPKRGRPARTKNYETVVVDVKKENEDDSDTEVSFNPGSLSPESQSTGQAKGRKRKRTESSRVPITNAWRGGEFQCVLCERSFGTPTFLMQHYVSPHFSRELRSEFGACLPKKRCPQCKSTFDTETKLLMHIGCTHREVHKYLPSKAKDLMPGVRNGASPTKIIKTPLKTATTNSSNEVFQKFAANMPKSTKQEKRSPPKSSSTTGELIPQLEDEFIS